MFTKQMYVVPDTLDGVRLDKVLAEVLEDSGLRLRRRLCDDRRVMAGGKTRKPGYKVRAGQEIVIQREVERMTSEDLGVTVVRQSGLFAAVYKPGRVHSAGIAGKDAPNVEALLPELFPGMAPILLNRLDFLTTGLLLVAMNKDGERMYHEMEKVGKIKKFYLATVNGRLDGLLSIRHKLDTDNRKKTRVLEEDDTDSRRWTDVEVLSHDHDNDATEVRCLIQKGARHQIRAHLASLGHPIVGDPLYGDGGEEDALRLHHQRIEFTGFSAEVKAPW